jgi:signal transduction histidine kinase
LTNHRDHLEELVEERTTELAQKNRELEQIVFTTSHDLRSPLVNIEGYSKYMAISARELKSVLQQIDVPKDIKEKVDSIVNKDIPESTEYISASIYKMDKLLNGLLKLSHTGQVELEKEKLDMNFLMSDVNSIFKFKSKETGTRNELSELPPCIGDKEQINQVFSNLISNALKYIHPKRPGVIKVSGYKDNGQSVYCIEDNGIGIAAENQEKIFGIFQQLKKESTGVGLGLTIVKKILERHDGKIWVESEKGKGSKFFVSLPS